MPLSKISANSKAELIAKIMEHEISKGKSKEQALAIAYAEAKARGFADGFAYHEMIAHFDSVSKMNGVLKIGVTLAAEMVQNYHRSEIPFLDQKLPPEIQFVQVFKPYEELAAAVDDLTTRGITQIPYVMPHTDGTFLENQVPSEAKEYMTHWIKDSEIKGWIKEFKKDDINRKIKGTLYLNIAQNDAVFVDKCIQGKVTDVSIGFTCTFDSGGIYKGKDYMLAQRKIQIGHLAGLLHDRGKCPSGLCGINQDATVGEMAEECEHCKEGKCTNKEEGQFGKDCAKEQKDACSKKRVKKGMGDEIFQLFPHLVQAYDFNHKSEIIDLRPDDTSHAYSTQIFTSNTMGTSGGLNIPDHQSIHSTEVFFPMTDEELKKLLESKDRELAETKTQLASIKESQTAIHDAKLEVAMLKETIKQKDASIEAMKGEVTKANEKIKKFEDVELDQIRGYFKSQKVETIADKKIDEYCLHDLRLLKQFDMAQKDAAIKSGNVPAASQEDRDKRTQGHDAEKPKFVSMTAQPNMEAK